MEGCSISGGCSGVVPKVTKRIGGGIEGIREALVGQNVLEHGGGVLGLRPDVVEDFLNEHQDPVTAMGKQGVKVAVKGEGAVVNVGEWGEVEATIEGLEIVQDGEEGWCEFFVLGRKGTLLIAGGARRRVVIGGGEVSHGTSASNDYSALIFTKKQFKCLFFVYNDKKRPRPRLQLNP